MHIHVDLLRQPERVRKALKQDGWDLESDPPASFWAQHRDVPDEAVARNRLADLGLLASASLRVEFEPPIFTPSSSALPAPDTPAR